MLANLLQVADWLVFLSLIAVVIGGIILGNYYVIRDGAEKRSDWLFALLLVAFSFTLLHILMNHKGMFLRFPRLQTLPIYFTLSLGPLLFYFVKIKLFPNYHLKWSDAKHLILPFGQIIYFIAFLFQPVPLKIDFERNFFSPFYGALEMLFYLITFFAYHYFAYRYILAKKHNLSSNASKKEIMRIGWLKRMIKVLFILFFLNAGYIITDFVAYEAMGVDLHRFIGFNYLGSVSFAGMLVWLSFNGWMMRKT